MVVAGSRIPDLDLQRVRHWCAQRIPAHLRDQVRVECDAGPGHLTVVECRPPWRKDMGPEWTRFPIARLHYTKSTKRWSLYWRDRNLRFHRYDQLPASKYVDDLLREIDRDPIAIFWG
jgi:hypothetical protein